MESQISQWIWTGILVLVLAGVAVATNSGIVAIAAGATALVAAWRSLRALWVVLLCLPFVSGCMQVSTRPGLQKLQLQSLGFTGHLGGGETKALPASVASALSADSDVVFRYEEKVTQHHSELPPALVIFLTSTAHLLGAPMGRDTVKASAELTILHGTREIGRYKGQAEVSRLYGLYYGSTMVDLENEARRQVRAVVDETLFQNARQIAAAVRALQP